MSSVAIRSRLPTFFSTKWLDHKGRKALCYLLMVDMWWSLFKTSLLYLRLSWRLASRPCSFCGFWYNQPRYLQNSLESFPSRQLMTAISCCLRASKAKNFVRFARALMIKRRWKSSERCFQQQVLYPAEPPNSGWSRAFLPWGPLQWPCFRADASLPPPPPAGWERLRHIKAGLQDDKHLAAVWDNQKQDVGLWGSHQRVLQRKSICLCLCYSGRGGHLLFGHQRTPTANLIFGSTLTPIADIWFRKFEMPHLHNQI